MRLRQPFLAASALALGCTPELKDEPYLLERDRLIAAIAEPPEVRPGAPFDLTPVVAVQRRAPNFSYHFCAEPPPPADPRSISETCLSDPGRTALTIDDSVAHGTMPADACARFGPDPVGSNFRPRDADDTGGFYQPIVIDGSGASAVAMLRITCPLPDVPIDLARAYRERYVANNNPTGLRIEREQNGEWQPLTAARRGESFAVRVTWDDAARERYVWLAPDAAALSERIESVEVAWFVSDGAVRLAYTGRAEDDPSNDSGNTFTAPSRAGTLQIWAVVRDGRGGSAALGRSLEVTE